MVEITGKTEFQFSADRYRNLVDRALRVRYVHGVAEAYTILRAIETDLIAGRIIDEHKGLVPLIIAEVNGAARKMGRPELGFTGVE